MTDQLIDDLSGEASGIHKGNLFIKIWTEPRDTLQFILTNYPKKYVFLLLYLAGMVRTVDRVFEKGIAGGGLAYNIGYLIGTVLFGSLIVVAFYYFYAWGMRITGKWLKGTASASSLRTVLAWSSIPSITTLLLLIPEFIVFKSNVLNIEPQYGNMTHTGIWFLFVALELTLSIWSLVIFVKGVNLVQGFGTWKSILNILLPALILFGLLMGIQLTSSF